MKVEAAQILVDCDTIQGATGGYDERTSTFLFRIHDDLEEIQLSPGTLF